MDFSATFGKPASQPRRSSGTDGLRFLIVGNFLGSQPDLPQATLPLGAGNFIEAFESLSPQLELEGEQLQFSEIEDFHPDQLLKKTPSLKSLFEQYRSIKKEGCDSIFFKALVAGREGWEDPDSTTKQAQGARSEDIFGELLGGQRPERPDAAPSPASSRGPAVKKLIQSALEGSEQRSDQDLYDLSDALRQLEGQLSAKLSKLLHHPDFQDLEGRWRQLGQLLAAVEDELGQPIQLLALNETQWQNWLDQPEQATWSIARELEQLGGVDAIFLSHRFGPKEPELKLLERLSTMAATAETPLVTGGHPGLIGHESLEGFFGNAEARLIEDSPWNRIKPRLNLNHLYLAVQGILVRLPYNPKDDPIESFDYAEDASPLPPGQLLYTDASLAVARIWLENTLETSSPMIPQTPRTLDDLPIYTVNGEMQPVAECWLSDAATEILHHEKLLPIRASKKSGSITVFL